MTIRRLVLWSLLGALLISAGAALAAGPLPPSKPPVRGLDPFWWYTPVKGDAFLDVIAGPRRGPPDTSQPPWEVVPIDPGGTNPRRASGSNRGPAAGKTSVSASLASPGTGSIGSVGGSVSLASGATSAPIRPDARDVRRELETARRALGL